MSTPLPPRPSGPGPDAHGSAMTAKSAPGVPGQGSEVDPLTVFDPAKWEADLRSLLMEDSRGREVLPIGRLGMARQATHGTLAIQLRDIERQAGVRRTL
jgi:hypothetical protein